MAEESENKKIDALAIGNTFYDIDLPEDATPSIKSLTASTITVKGTSNLTDVIISGSIATSSTTMSKNAFKLTDLATFSFDSTTGTLTIKKIK